jgi:XTP/dITP diphosphohydrolase
MKIILASNNTGKIKEFQTLLTPFDLTVVPQAAAFVTEIPETGLTFVENAIIKARNACQQTGLPALADDSGLHVNALRGAPGIYSARYAGENATSAACIEKLLQELKTTPDENRQASFHCVLVYMSHAEDPTPLICHGTWHGSIVTTQQGQGGFGYDPVFFVASENKTAAELPAEVKNRLSHRGQAFKMLMAQLPEKIDSVDNNKKLTLG